MNILVYGIYSPLPKEDLERIGRMVLRTAQDAMVYAHHADDHSYSRNLQTQLLKMFNTWRSSWAPEPSLLGTSYRDIFWLRHATWLSLPGYVGDILAREDQATQSNVAQDLLCIFHGVDGLQWVEFPLLKHKMIQTLLRMCSNHLIYSPALMPRLKIGLHTPPFDSTEFKLAIKGKEIVCKELYLRNRGILD
jgi:hypothetical protein